MRHKNQFISIFLFISILWAPSALAQLDYCLLSEKKFDIHIFGESYNTEGDRGALLRGIDKIKSEFKMGDEVRWISHANGSERIQKKCLPGCPSKGLVGDFVDGTCSKQVAKKDNVAFRDTYVRVIKGAFGNSGNEYSAIGDMRALQDYYQERDLSNIEVFVFHTTVPFGVELTDKSSFDSAFVSAVQSQNLSNISLNDLMFVNANQSENVRKYWEDLALEGHESGFKADFIHIVRE
jgi:hypothetical protein